jgi:hypothetical protein
MASVSLATEGSLDEQVLRQVLAQTRGEGLAPAVCYVQNGRPRLRENLPRFNQAARFQPFIVLADLEGDECPPRLIREWLPDGAHSHLLLRVAVRMIESWLLADREALASFLGVPLARLPSQPDDELDPKQKLVNLARRSHLRRIREDLVPVENSTSRIGKNYNGQLTRFVATEWNAPRASQHSPSLARAIRALQNFQPSSSR